MTLDFVYENFVIGQKSPDLSPQFVFYKRGFRLNGSSGSVPYTDIVLSGNGSLTLTNAKANGLNYVKLYGACEQNGTPTPSQPVDIVCNNGALKVIDNELPSGYKRLKDIVFDGDIYYITDVYLTGHDTTTFTINASEGSRNVIGCYTGDASGNNISFYLNIGSVGNYVRYKDSLYRPVLSNGNLNTDITLSITPTGTTGFNTNSTWTELDFTCPNLLYIGWLANASSPKFKGAFKGNVEVEGRAKYIPCERESDNTIGYYNLTSNTFIEPQGTGTPTTSGYDFSHYVLTIDGTVETVEVYGNNIFNKNDTANIGNWYSSSNKISIANANATLVMRAIPNATYYYKHCSVTGGGRAFYTEVEDWRIGSDCSEMMGSTIINKDEVKSITVSANAKWVFFNYGRSALTATFEEQLADYMVSLAPITASTPYENYYNGGSATAEMLLNVGDYQDVQSVLNGVVTRNVGIYVMTGNESFGSSSTYWQALYIQSWAGRNNAVKRKLLFCSHFLGIVEPSGTVAEYTCFTNASGHLYFRTSETATDFKRFLADQYANGTPVIVVYPLAEPTTESVTPQTLTTQAGTNVVEITQASINNLGLEVSYKERAS